MRFDETIVAIASPTSPGSRGVVRLSGDECGDVLEQMGFDRDSGLTASRSTHQIDLGAPLGDVEVDLLHWPTRRSYTGQPSAELHTVGAAPILSRVLDAAIASGARIARPGEFTMRAFLAGRLDLTQAEAVLGVIEAEQPGSLDHALEQLAGNLSRPLNDLRDQLLDLLADVEAGLDFIDEDIEFISDETLVDRLESIGAVLKDTMTKLHDRGGQNAVTTVALCGDPNAGKSQLFNRLCGRTAAIVSDVAGTTRDFVSANVMIEGHQVHLEDTAGLETPTDGMTQAAQQKTEQTVFAAEIRLWCIDATRADFSQASRRMISHASQTKRASSVDIVVLTKRDLVNDSNLRAPDHSWAGEPGFVGVVPCSAISGEGIDELHNCMVEQISRRDGEQVGSVLGTAARCGETLSRAIASIQVAMDQVRAQVGHEFVSAEIREAVKCVGEVTGEVYNDDILDRVFGRFCIGK